MNAPRSVGAVVDGVELIDGCIVRRARKLWTCRGDGAGVSGRAHACTDNVIHVGDLHVEYIGEAEPFHSGTRHCASCAVKFFVKPEGGEVLPW